MKRLLFTAMLLATLGSHAQTLLGERPEIVTAYLGLMKAKHQAVYDSCHQTALVVRDMEDGAAVFYFKDEECISYSIVRYGVRLEDVERAFHDYERVSDHQWQIGAENAYISVVYEGGSAYINVLKVY